MVYNIGGTDRTILYKNLNTGFIVMSMLSTSTTLNLLIKNALNPLSTYLQ